MTDIFSEGNVSIDRIESFVLDNRNYQYDPDFYHAIEYRIFHSPLNEHVEINRDSDRDHVIGNHGTEFDIGLLIGHIRGMRNDLSEKQNTEELTELEAIQLNELNATISEIMELRNHYDKAPSDSLDFLTTFSSEAENSLSNTYVTLHSDIGSGFPKAFLDAIFETALSHAMLLNPYVTVGGFSSVIPEIVENNISNIFSNAIVDGIIHVPTSRIYG